MPRGRTAKGTETRSRLLEAAATVFGARGYHAAKVSEIVAAAGVTQAAFYLYFATKEAAFQELVTTFRTDLLRLTERGRAIQAPAPAQVPEQTRTNFETLFRFLMASPARTRLALYEAAESEEIKREMALALAENFRANQAAGHLRPDLPVTVAADCLVGMVDRLTSRRLLTGVQEPEALAAQAAGILLYGILPHGRQRQ